MPVCAHLFCGVGCQGEISLHRPADFPSRIVGFAVDGSGYAGLNAEMEVV